MLRNSRARSPRHGQDCLPFFRLRTRKHRRVHDRQGVHRFACNRERARVMESLQHLLDDRQAGHDLIEIDDTFERRRGTAAEHGDPDG